MSAALSTPRDLTAEALALPERARAALAARLLASLRPSGVPSADDPGLRDEIHRRAERVRHGESGSLDWDEVVRDLEGT